MVKCGKCNKIFDYDKYYGICPECGAYNRKNISGGQTQLQKENNKGSHMTESPIQMQADKGSHMEEPIQKQAADGGGSVFPEDSAKRMNPINPGDPADPAGQRNPTGPEDRGNASCPGPSPRPAYNAPRPRCQLAENTPPIQRQRKANSPGTIALFVCLVVGIAMTILVPIGYIIGKAVMISTEPAYNSNGIISEAQKEAGKQQPQKADTVTVNPQKEFRVGKQKSQTLRADRAYVLLPAGLIKEFPAGEKLVAVETSYQNDDSEKDHYFKPLSVLYAGYGENTYKEAVAPGALDSFPDVVGDRKVVDASGMSYGEGSGVILFFVPEDVKEIQVYFESRNEDTNEMLEIYEVSLEIAAGEGEK